MYPQREGRKFERRVSAVRQASFRSCLLLNNGATISQLDQDSIHSVHSEWQTSGFVSSPNRPIKFFAFRRSQIAPDQDRIERRHNSPSLHDCVDLWSKGVAGSETLGLVLQHPQLETKELSQSTDLSAGK